MFIRAVISTTVLLTALTLAFTACGGGEPVSISTLASVPAPEPSYLTEEIPSCTPVGGSSVDPCEPGLVQTSGGMSRFIDSEPWSVRFFLGDERTSGVHAAHLVVAVRTSQTQYAASAETSSVTRPTRMRTAGGVCWVLN